jgi:hypothetical protein
MFARIAVGRLVQRDGGVSHTDPFAYTPKLDRWVDPEWLSGVIFWRVAEFGGDGWSGSYCRRSPWSSRSGADDSRRHS